MKMSSSRSVGDTKKAKAKGGRRREEMGDDGSQAWCIVMSCFVVNVFVMGFLKCLGILIIELMKAFAATPAHVSILVSITACLNCTAGPLACYLAVVWSARTVAFVGTSLVSFGLMLSYFAHSMTHLYISLGVFVGFGSGLTYSPGMILIGNYFRKNRGMANGVVVSGSPVGGMLMPYVFNFLVCYLGIRGALLIFGGLMMNTVVCTLSYRPYRKSKKNFLRANSSAVKAQDSANLRRISASACIHPGAPNLPSTSNRHGDSSDDSSGPEFVDYGIDSTSKQRVLPSQSASSSVVVYKVNERYGEKSHVRKADENSVPIPSKPPLWFASSKHGPHSSKMSKRGDTLKEGDTTNFSTTDVVQGQRIQPKESQTEIHSSGAAMHPFALSRLQRNSGGGHPTIFSSRPEGAASTSGRLVSSASPPASKDFRISSSTGTGLRHRKPRPHDLIPPKRKDLQATSTKKLSPYILSLDHSCVIMWSNDDLTKAHDALTSSKAAILQASWSGADGPFLQPNSSNRGAMGDNPNLSQSSIHSSSEPPKSCAHTALTWIRTSPLSNWTFLILLISNASTAIATTNILLLFPSLGEHRGLSKAQSSTVYLIISLCDLIARLSGSFLSDRRLVTPQAVFAVGLLFAGASSVLIAFMTSFWALSFFAGLFGLACGLHIGIYGTLLAEILGVELLHVGYAISMLVNGILQFSFIWISGHILSTNKDAFSPLYVFYGLCLLLGASLWLLPLLLWAKHKFHSSSNEDVSTQDDFFDDSDFHVNSPQVNTKQRNSENTGSIVSNVSFY